LTFGPLAVEAGIVRTDDRMHPGRIPVPHRPALAALLLATASAPLAALEIEPGLWTFETVTTNAFTGEQGHTHTECLTAADMDPDRFQQDMGECENMDVQDSADEMAWSFTCETDQAKGRGDGRIVAENDESVRGEMRFVMDMSAMGGGPGMKEFVVDTTWSGRRVGECK
jgi:hypothetical protein